MDSLTRSTLKADAIFDFSFGTLMLLAPWITGVYRLLDLPNPQPAVYTQFCGGLLLVCAYLLWLAPANVSLARPVALSIGLVNLAGAVLLAGWIVSGALGIGGLGTAIFGLAIVILAFFAVVELRYAFAQA